MIKMMKEFEKKYGRIFIPEDPALPRKLMEYPWPGNIRELENCLERLCVLSDDGYLRMKDLPPSVVATLNRDGSSSSGTLEGDSLANKASSGPENGSAPGSLPNPGMQKERVDYVRSSLQGAFERKRGLPTIAEAEEFLIRRALETTEGSVSKAAELLNVHRNTIRNKMQQYGIDRKSLENG